MFKQSFTSLQAFYQFNLFLFLIFIFRNHLITVFFLYQYIILIFYGFFNPLFSIVSVNMINLFVNHKFYSRDPLNLFWVVCMLPSIFYCITLILLYFLVYHKCILSPHHKNLTLSSGLSLITQKIPIYLPLIDYNTN